MTVLEITRLKELNAIFQENPAPDTSKRYSYINTMDVVNFLSSLGWKPVDANQIKPRKRKGYQKHLIKFEHEDFRFNDEAINLIMINSHDGKSSMQFKLGIFRFACSNGLVVGQNFHTYKFRHSNVNMPQLEKAMQEIHSTIPELAEHIQTMKITKLTNNQIIELAKQSMMLRFEDKFENITFDMNELLETLRDADKQNSLWNFYNKMQEKMVNGLIHYTDTAGKTRKLRKLTSINKLVKLNSNMFDLMTTRLN